MRKIITILFTLFLCGCSSIPFKRIEYVSLEGIEPQVVRLQFSQRIPQSFEVVNSTVFAYRHLKLSCLGPTHVDTLKQNFSVVGLNYVGMKLFELSFKNGTVDSKYIFPELAKRGDFAQAVCEDIKKIYFDRIPASESSVIQKRHKIIFRQAQSGGFLEYVFAGRDNLLIEKNSYANGRKLWSVFYYEYVVNEKKVFPVGIILRHYPYNYQLVVRLKEIRESE
ncbi:hypothetical protein D4R78_07955 [bacterium]|nr:MAG: hypothetical protein D4R78_07955 [bacterium]